MTEIPNHNHLTDAPPEERMRALLEVVSSYIEQYHGGSVDLVEFDGEIVKVKLGGACEGCELSEGTLRGWVEGSVRQFFPDITRVESVE
jgi:Fe-S cluster biogenesis protein NfuA